MKRHLEIKGMPSNPASLPPDQGDSIERLFQDLESPLLSYALRLTGDREAAEDIVQEAFMRLHAQFETVQEPRRWIYRTTHNLALNYKRDTSRTIPLTQENDSGSAQTMEPTDPKPLPDEEIARWEGIGLVRLSLNTLDQRSREMLHLKFHESLSYKEISERTGCTVGHVGYILHHALKAVARELARNGIAQ